MKLLIVNILLLLLFIKPTVYAQIAEDKNSNVQKVEIPKDKINNYKKDKEFDYSITTEKNSIFSRIYNWLKRILYKILYKIFSWLFGLRYAGKIVGKIIAILPYIALVIFVYLIFRYLLGIDLIRLRKRKNVKMPSVDMSEEERIIKHENLDKLIQQAVDNNDYRLAVRYYYLKTLKLLTQKELIDWKPEKTNRDYIKELSSTRFTDKFRRITFAYDFVWYGNFLPDKKDFIDIKRDFERFFSNNFSSRY